MVEERRTPTSTHDSVQCAPSYTGNPKLTRGGAFRGLGTAFLFGYVIIRGVIRKLLQMGVIFHDIQVCMCSHRNR